MFLYQPGVFRFHVSLPGCNSGLRVDGTDPQISVSIWTPICLRHLWGNVPFLTSDGPLMELKPFPPGKGSISWDVSEPGLSSMEIPHPAA